MNAIQINNLTIPLDGGSGTIAVKDITGLGAAKKDIFLSDGWNKKYLGYNNQPRHIVITLICLKEAEKSREKIYGAMSGGTVILSFIYPDKVFSTTAYVEAVESGIFKKNATIVLSLVSPDPYFSTSDSVHLFGTYQDGFTFPFTNPLHKRTLHFAELRDSDHISVNYEGSAPTAPIFKFTTTSWIYLTNFSLYEVRSGNKVTFPNYIPAPPGTELTIDSVNKEIYYTNPTGEKHDLFNEFTWEGEFLNFELVYGKNLYIIASERNHRISGFVLYSTKYEGV